jgi:cobalamin biosynthesis protein CobT
MPTRKVIVEYNDKHMDFYKKYPASAFPKLPIIRDIDIEPHSLLYRINQNILQRLSTRTRNIETVYSQFIYNTDSRESSNRADSSGESSIIENTNNHYENEDDEDEEDEEDENEEDEEEEDEDEEQEYEYLEEDTTDGSDSVS